MTDEAGSKDDKAEKQKFYDGLHKIGGLTHHLKAGHGSASEQNAQYDQQGSGFLAQRHGILLLFEAADVLKRRMPVLLQL